MAKPSMQSQEHHPRANDKPRNCCRATGRLDQSAITETASPQFLAVLAQQLAQLQGTTPLTQLYPSSIGAAGQTFQWGATLILSAATETVTRQSLASPAHHPHICEELHLRPICSTPPTLAQQGRTNSRWVAGKSSRVLRLGLRQHNHLLFLHVPSTSARHCTFNPLTGARTAIPDPDHTVSSPLALQ